MSEENPIIIEDSSEPSIPGMVRPSPIANRFHFSDKEIEAIKKLPVTFGFDGFGEAVYYRTYSRRLGSPEDGRQETFHDTAIRVIEGVMSIRKDWYIRNGLLWEEDRWNSFAIGMVESMLRMDFLPPGRGLYICGSEFMYQRGGAALFNCGFTATDDLVKSAVWTFDMLMCGCGVGFDSNWDGKISLPDPDNITLYIIHDSREGWDKSLLMLLDSYMPSTTGERKRTVIFDYSRIRPFGTPINGFGGTASGSKPLETLHDRIRAYMKCFARCNPDRVVGEKLDLMNPYDATIAMIQSLNEDTSNWKTGKKVSEMIKEQQSFIESLRSMRYDSFTIKEFKDRTDWNYFSKITGFDEDESGNDNSSLNDRFVATLREISTEDRMYLIQYAEKSYGPSRLIADIFNAIGCCVVAGNVRRSSEIYLGEPRDLAFLNMKNYTINPERECIGWMSNNTIRLTKTEDFMIIPDIANRIKKNAEPGLLNLINGKRGRLCRTVNIGREAEEDKATGLNPCVAGDNLILTDKGMRYVTELVGKQFNAVVNGKICPSTAEGFWSSGVKKVFKVTLDNGIVVRATDNHPFYIHESGKKETVKCEVKDLQIGTEVSIADNREWIESLMIKDENGMYSVGIKHEKKIDHSMGYIAGISLSKKSDHLKEYGIISQRNTIYERGNRDYNIGFIQGIFNYDADVVELLKSNSSEIVLDGHELRELRSIQRILLTMGILSVIEKNSLVISKESMVTFYSTVGFTDVNKQSQLERAISELALNSTGQEFKSKVISIEEDGEEEVYDCTIYGQHRFSCNGAVVSNCGEILLESGELCNLSEVFLPRCLLGDQDIRGFTESRKRYGMESMNLFNGLGIGLRPEAKMDSNWERRYYKAIEYSTFYSSTVSLLPTHWSHTNSVTARNRRIGVSQSGLIEAYESLKSTKINRLLRDGYRYVRAINQHLAKEAGVVESIRVTTVKPSGSISQVAGVSSGIHFPIYNHAIRRMRVSTASPICSVLKASGYKFENDKYTANTIIFQFPIDQSGTRSADKVGMWEQFLCGSAIQREWSDNSVSQTVMFSKSEEPSLEHAIALIMPTIKTVSAFPIATEEYEQAPYERITKEKYLELKAELKPMAWETFKGDGEIPRGCTTEFCEREVSDGKKEV